ncbi:MAG: nitrogenase molybdenum-iron protein subunit beta, partial [Vallitaleaceae bacterium]|nr:nitrogenase molybdenum-iron protein subunit beta [Vallitaleaceae bacterium]
LTRHYRDPIIASTSSFTEGACVFGGKSNLKKGLENVFEIYNPEVVAINTTCLSETIGDDIAEIIKSTDVPEGKTVLFANTPSYQGSHITGFSNMCKAMVTHIAEKKEGKNSKKINILPGFIEPSDMAEIKRYAELLEVPYTMFPDTSNVVATPNTGRYEMYPEGGTTVKEIKKSGNAMATIALGKFSSEAAAFELEKKCEVEPFVLKEPIGIKATDAFVMKLLELNGGSIPDELELERGQLVDVMVDVHHHYHGKKVALFGDPDLLIAMTEFVIDLGMIPTLVLTGTPGKSFLAEIQSLFDQAGLADSKVMVEEDLFTFHQIIKEDPVDLIMGNTYGKYIARAEGTPMVRIGWPILDRVGHSYFPIVGYRGALRIIEKITSALLDHYDRTCAEEDFELVM